MDFIFMLTRHDATVPDALDLIEPARRAGVRHIGFKDVGAAPERLVDLAKAIREAGASVWMEVVSTNPRDELASVRLARDLAVDSLMGGVQAESALRVLEGTPVRYLPFPGRPVGHPTRLEGSPEDVEADCRRFALAGCAGADLLAFRAVDADALALVAAARRGLGPGGRLIAAGSIDGRARVRALKAAGADGFTIGAAAIAGVYAPGAGDLEAQLRAVLRDAAD